MKKLFLLLIFAFTTVVVNAQLGYNYKPYAIGFDISYERGYTNLAKQYNHSAKNINFIYNFTPYIPIAAEIQFGTLSGGGLTPDIDKSGRQYANNYKAFIVHGDLGLGEIIDFSQGGILNIVKNFYFGTGLGFVYNSNQVQRYNLFPQNGPLTYKFPGQDKSFNINLPLRFGYEIKIYNSYDEPFMAIDLGYVHNMVYGEGLDGYDDPSKRFKNNATNQYRQISLGVKFSFGNILAYNKSIRNF